jgi:hypothetical protein
MVDIFKKRLKTINWTIIIICKTSNNKTYNKKIKFNKIKPSKKFKISNKYKITMNNKSKEYKNGCKIMIKSHHNLVKCLFNRFYNNNKEIRYGRNNKML